MNKITVREASQLTGYATEYIRELCRTGRIKSEKFGTVLMVDRNNLLLYQREQMKRRGETPKS